MQNMCCNIATARGKVRALRAFTLMEVLVAVLIIGIVFGGFYVSLTQGFQIMQSCRANTRATQLLMQQMETIRLYTWCQINSNGFVPTRYTAPMNLYAQTTNSLDFTCTVVITNAPMTESYASNHVLVTVSVAWTSYDGMPHTREMSTLVSQYGLHNYYY